MHIVQCCAAYCANAPMHIVQTLRFKLCKRCDANCAKADAYCAHEQSQDTHRWALAMHSGGRVEVTDWYAGDTAQVVHYGVGGNRHNTTHIVAHDDGGLCLRNASYGQ